MKNKTFFSHSFLSSVAAIALFMPAAAHAEDMRYAKLSDWHISPVTQTKGDMLPYCALASQYDNNVIMTNTRNRADKGSLALEFPNVKFKPNELYRVDITVGDGDLKRSFAGKAVKETMLVVKIGQDDDFFNAMSQGEDMVVQLEKGAVTFPLAGHAKSFFELKYCVDALPPIVKETKPFVPATIEEEKETKPQPVSIYAPKVTPPTLQEKYKIDQQKRARAAVKFNPIPIEEDTATAMAAGIAENAIETPTVLKSGYVSPKKRLYEPKTPNEDISEEQRAASLKATLEKARAKALSMEDGKEQTAAETASAQTKPVEETAAKIAPFEKVAQEPETVIASTTSPDRIVPEKVPTTPSLTTNDVLWDKTVPPVSDKIPADIEVGKTVPPVAFNRPASSDSVGLAPAGTVIPPVDTPLIEQDSAPVQTTTAPVVEKAPVVEQAELEPAPAPVSAPVIPVQPQRQPTIIHHTVDFMNLPPEALPTAPWQVDLVDNVPVPYCSISTLFDNGVRLFANRSQDGLSTVGIDFGMDLLQPGRSYKTTLAAQDLYEDTFKAKAHNARLLVIQAGKQDALHFALLKAPQFVIAIPGADMVLNTSETKQAASDFNACLGKISAALDGTQEPFAPTSTPATHEKQAVKPTIKAPTAVTQPPQEPTHVQAPTKKTPVVVPPAIQAPQQLAKPAYIPPTATAEPVEQAEPPKSAIPPKVTVPVDQDPSIIALKERAEHNRKALEASIQKRAVTKAEQEEAQEAAAEPISYTRSPAPKKKLAPLPKDEVISYARIPAPEVKNVAPDNYDALVTAKEDPNFVRQANANLSLIEDTLESGSNPTPSPTASRLHSPLEEAAYPVEDILKTSDINVTIGQSSDTAFKWINPATGVKGEVILLSTADGTDNIDHLLSIREKDTQTCPNADNFSFQIGDTNRYSVSTVTSADSLCITPMDVSSSTYILHNNGVGLYEWRFSGETPSALMVERDKILATINANVNN